MNYKKLTPTPNRVILKISGESRKDIFEKEYRRPDGTSFRIVVTVDEKDGFDRKSELFVQYAEVISVGRNVKYIEVGDTALLSNLVDNDKNCFLGWDGQDKYVSVRAVSTYYEEDIVVSKNRSGLDRGYQTVAKKGHLWEATDVIGCLRGEQLIAIDPYVFLEHRQHGIVKSQAGIVYKDDDPLAKTTVLAVSPESTDKYGVRQGESVIVKHADTFDVKAGWDKLFFACNDEDVIAGMLK